MTKVVSQNTILSTLGKTGHREGMTTMTECRFYERDDAAFLEHLDYMRACAMNHSGETDEEPKRPCYNFCKHYELRNGFPGEALHCCGHPENKHIIDCDSVFDGVTDHTQRMRILDAIC